MLYFLIQTFNMHDSHIHSFLTHFPCICYNDKNFERYRFLVQTVLLRYPSYVDVVKSNGRYTKMRMVLENRKCGFAQGKDNFDCIEVSIHTVHRQQIS